MKSKIIVVFIDRVAEKNKLQIDVMRELGYRVVFFVNEYDNKSKKYFNKNDSYRKLSTSFFYRVKQVISFLVYKRKKIHHIEIYPGGRFAFIYVLSARLIGLKTICVERGDLLYYRKGGYDKFTRFSMWFCYKFSHSVWYRETYMKLILDRMGVKNLHFIHNAIERSKLQKIKLKSFTEKDIDFLWLNRVIPQRKSEWIINILRNHEFSNTKNFLVGILEKTRFEIEQFYVINNRSENLEVINYVEDPTEYFLRAKFFVLPAEIVFANNSLLEAMNYGVVPIVTESPGVDEIVINGVNGFVSEFTQESFHKAMKSAINLNKCQFNQMSKAAIQYIENKFSRKIYKERLQNLYDF